MADYILSACSTADLTKEQFEQYDINCVFFHFTLDGKQYPDDLGQTMKFEDFYNKMAEGADAATSQVNPDEFIEAFKPFLEAGKDILHCTLSSGISGVHNSAIIARNELQEMYPDRKIIIVDSLAASAGYGMLMVEASKKKSEGASIDELAAWLEERKLKLGHWFYVSELKYLVKGGRVSKASGVIGDMLNICPVLNVNNEGKLIARHKVRGKKKAAKKIVEQLLAEAQNGADYEGPVWISTSNIYDDAEYAKKLIKEAFPKMKDDIIINSIGTVIGSHTGPGAVAVFFWAKDDRIE